MTLRSQFHLKEAHINNEIFILYLSICVRMAYFESDRDGEMVSFGSCYKIRKHCYGQLQSKT